MCVCAQISLCFYHSLFSLLTSFASSKFVLVQKLWIFIKDLIIFTYRTGKWMQSWRDWCSSFFPVTLPIIRDGLWISFLKYNLYLLRVFFCSSTFRHSATSCSKIRQMNHLLEAYECCRQDQTYNLSVVLLLGVVILVNEDLSCGFREEVGGGVRSLEAVKMKVTCIYSSSCWQETLPWL